MLKNAQLVTALCVCSGGADCRRPERSHSYLGSEDRPQWTVDSRTRGLSKCSAHRPRCQLHGSSQQLGESPRSLNWVMLFNSNILTNVFSLFLQGNCYVWNMAGGIGEEVTQLIPKTKIPAHNRYSLRCKFSPDSTSVYEKPHSASFTVWKYFSHVIFRLLATCSADQTCKIWRTSNFSLMTELSIKSNNPGETSRGWMWDCAFSGDSQYIVTGQSKTGCKRNCNLMICFKIFECLIDFNLFGVSTVNVVCEWLWNFDFLPIASSDNLARLWCVETGEIKREYSGHQKAVVCLAFNDSVLGWGRARGEQKWKAHNKGPFGECNRRYFMCWEIGRSYWNSNMHYVWTTPTPRVSVWKDLTLFCYEYASLPSSLFLDLAIFIVQQMLVETSLWLLLTYFLIFKLQCWAKYSFAEKAQ